MSLVILLSIFVNLIVEVRQGILENKGNKTENSFSSRGCAKYDKIDMPFGCCPEVAESLPNVIGDQKMILVAMKTTKNMGLSGCSELCSV